MKLGTGFIGVLLLSALLLFLAVHDIGTPRRSSTTGAVFTGADAAEFWVPLSGLVVAGYLSGGSDN